MFAVVQTGGKQYKVAKDDVIKVEKLDCEEGATVILDQVLAFGDGKNVTLGAPLVKDVSVAAEVIGVGKDKKVIIFKKKRRHNYRRKKGHRQEQVWLKISDIGKGLKAKAAPKKAEAKASKPAAKKETIAEKAPAKKAVAKKAVAKKAEDK